MKHQQMQMDDPMGRIHVEISELKRSIWWSQVAAASLIVVAFALVIAIAVIGQSHGQSIRDLRDREGLLTNPNITFATQSGNRSIENLTYGGSLFRGSGFWAAKPSLPGRLADHAVIAYNDFIYIIGGIDELGNVTAAVWRYDTILHNYTVLTSMPEPRYRFGAAIVGSKIFIVGGRNIDDNLYPDKFNSALVKSTFIYDIEKDRWFKGADALEYQGDCCAAALDGKIYLIGGYGYDYEILGTSEVYDPSTDKWTRILNLPTPRGDLMCAALNGEIYVLGGYFNNTPNGFSTKMESFNPATGIWTTRPDILTPRGDAAAVVLPGERIMLIGGEGHYRQDTSFKYPKHVNEVYYASDQTWVQKAMIPTARFRTAAATSGGIAYVFGGADVCVSKLLCPTLDKTEIFLDVDHPHVYIYIKGEAYNDNSALTTYPL